MNKIGDRVWYATNHDGITVNLLDCQETVLETTTTDADGLYSFGGVLPGSYTLAFVPPPRHAFSPQNEGGDPALDSDPNPTTGETACFSFPATQDDLTWEAGLYEPGQPPPVVSEASTLLLLGSGAAGLAGYADLQLCARRRRDE